MTARENLKLIQFDTFRHFEQLTHRVLHKFTGFLLVIIMQLVESLSANKRGLTLCVFANLNTLIVF